MTDTIPNLTTAGVIARKLQQPLHRITHILNTRAHIQPTARAGVLRLYDRAAIEMIRDELAAIDAKREAVPA